MKQLHRQKGDGLVDLKMTTTRDHNMTTLDVLFGMFNAFRLDEMGKVKATHVC